TVLRQHPQQDRFQGRERSGAAVRPAATAASTRAAKTGMSVASSAAPRTEEELDERLSEPRDATIDALRNAPGDIILLGAGGKMGPTLARMAARATAAADSPGSGRPRRVIAVSRFTSGALPRTLERHGVETLQCDLLDP